MATQISERDTDTHKLVVVVGGGGGGQGHRSPYADYAERVGPLTLGGGVGGGAVSPHHPPVVG